MRKAIISDVHGNLNALQFILEDIDQQGIDELIYLGDTFSCAEGQADTDLQCLDILMDRAALALLGNRDQGVIVNDRDHNLEFRASEALYNKLCEPCPENIRRWEFLNGLNRIHIASDRMMFFHGSPRFPLHGYISEKDIYDPAGMAYEFRMIHNFGFHGHTHTQDIISSRLEVLIPRNKENPEWVFPKELDANQKYFIGVGSIGEPRGPNPKTAYVILEDRDNSYRVQFRQFPIQ